MDNFTMTVNGKIFGMTDEGWKMPSFEDCYAQKLSEWRAVWGENKIKADAEDKFNQKITTEAECFYNIWGMFNFLHFANDPSQAPLQSLPKHCRLVGAVIKKESKTKVTAIATGDNGTVIPAGAICSTKGGDQFKVLGSVKKENDVDVITLGAVKIEDGTATLSLEAMTYGAIACPAGELTIINTPEIGWDTIYNENNGITGRATPNAAEIRAERDATVTTGGSGRVDKIEQELNDEPDIEKAIVFENDTKYVNERGQEGNTLEPFVIGGTPDRIAEILWQNRPGAPKYVGNTYGEIVDSRGVLRKVPYSVGQLVEYYAIVTVTEKTDDFPQDGDAQIEAKLLAAAGENSYNDDVVLEYLKGSYSAVKGLRKSTLWIGTKANPTTEELAQQNDIEISDIEKSILTSERVTVNVGA